MEQEVNLICFSHLRWNFVFQRPQHLLTRSTKQFAKVYYVEEPFFDSDQNRLPIDINDSGVTVVTPHLINDGKDPFPRIKGLLENYFENELNGPYVAWYYTPMAVDWFNSSKAIAVIYDCMDELSLFKDAPLSLIEKEKQLLAKADLVFTGGVSLYHHKRKSHGNVYAFPSSVDFSHFAKARSAECEPIDQASIPHPRIGFFGVIDERMDLELLAGLADLRPDFHLVIIGPVVKIDEGTLPRRENIHYLGSKNYTELPQYLSGWDVAMMPFARNDSTRFISPTKTPEYLAAGCPVVSTSISDVVSPYGEKRYVRIANTAAEFAEACLQAMKENVVARRKRVDEFLSQMSWDITWRSMYELMHSVMEPKLRQTVDLGSDATEKRHV